VFAWKLAAWARAAENGLGRVGKVRGRPIVFGSATLAIAEEQRPVGGAEKADELAFYDHAAGVFDGRSVGSQRIGIGFIYLHPAPPVLLQASS
jgi:hypothetical protein